MVQLASSYNFQAWYYSYDQDFRLFLANNPGSRWDVCNEDIIYNVHLRGSQGRNRCFSCRKRDHFAALYPKRRMLTSSSFAFLLRPAQPLLFAISLFYAPRSPGSQPSLQSFAGTSIPIMYLP